MIDLSSSTGLSYLFFPTLPANRINLNNSFPRDCDGSGQEFWKFQCGYVIFESRAHISKLKTFFVLTFVWAADLGILVFKKGSAKVCLLDEWVNLVQTTDDQRVIWECKQKRSFNKSPQAWIQNSKARECHLSLEDIFRILLLGNSQFKQLRLS